MDKTELTPANENPWYQLMTLYGEQDGEEFDKSRHQDTLIAWGQLNYSPLKEQVPNGWEGKWRTFGINRDNWGTLDSQYCVRAKDPDAKRPTRGAVVLKGLRFSAPVYLSGFAFAHDVTIEDCVFEQGVFFDDCLFNAALTFKTVVFERGLSMKDAGCVGSFQMVDVQSFGDIKFRGSRFGGTFKCNGFQAGATPDQRAPISFKEARFDGFVDFSDETFADYAVFEGADFKSRAMFSRASFEKGVSFRRAVFRDYAYFNTATFCSAAHTETHHINFTESRFERPPTFRDAIFKGEYPNLAGAILHERSVFTTHAKGWPSRSEIEERDSKASATSEQVAAESAAILRGLTAKQSLPDEEHFFFRREMEFAGQIGSWTKRLPYFLFGVLSDYGHSIARPANTLLALWLWIILVYTEGAEMGILEALGYSFANMFKFFGLQRTYFDYEVIHCWPAWVQVVSAAQTVLAFIFLFFLGLGLRTRFRLR